MQSDQKVYPGKEATSVAYGVGDYTHNIPVLPALDAGLLGSKQMGLLHGVQLQASEMCPKNFIIFDRADDKSRIMFHPALVNKLNVPGIDVHTAYTHDRGGSKHTDKGSSSLKEDSKDIDALLSLEDEEDEDEEVSTGRTMGNYGSSSPDCCSVEHLKSPETWSASIQKSFSCSRNSSGGSSRSERKQQRMKKMLKVLRGIVPGGDRMDTAAFIDEAVRHLKYLKAEVKKLGIEHLKK